MGLLDSLGYGNQGGYGGLLDMLMYPSPLAQKPEYNPYAGINTAFDTSAPQPSNPFGAPPQMSAPPASNATFGPVPQFGPQPPQMPAPSFDSFGQKPGTFSQMAPTLPPAINVGSGGNVAPLSDAPPAQAASIGGTQPSTQPSATDFSAQSRQPPQQTQPTFMGGNSGAGFGDRLMAGVQNFANAGGPLQALAGGISGLVSGNRTDPQGMQQQNLKAQYEAVRQALIENGETPQAASSKALAAALNPEAAKTILPELFTSKQKYGVISENPIEGKKYGFVNERDQTINGKPMGSEASGQNSTGLLAPGVSGYNPNLSGNEYLAQFSPEVQAAVKSYIAGDVMPSGNPRQQGIAAQAKTIAQKYGADLGIPVSDALYGEKRKYRTELGTNSANSAGGQAKAFNQGIFHLTELADKLEKLDNSNGLGIPVIAQGVNAVRQGMSNEQSAISDEAKSIGQTVAGEVGKLFSGAAGGGVHERELTRERFDTIKSKPQLAAALRATLVTMDGGLKALEQNRDRVLGPNSGVDFVGEQTKQNIAKIQGAIDRLEGKSSGGIPSGWSVKVH